MDYKYIEQLLERYWQCETTLEEEQILRTFFSQENVPACLLPYKDLFTYEQSDVEENVLGDEFDKMMLEMTGEAAPVKARTISMVQRLKPLFKAAAIVAIILTLGNASQVAFQPKDTPRITENDLYEKPTDGVEVAKADGKYIDGREYKPFEYTVGSTSLIRGWDKGIAGLPAGSSVRLIIPSALGYGERGAGEDIPPFSPLMFDIDIISVN